MRYVSAMLAPSGPGRMAERAGLFAVATVGALAVAPSAGATTYFATWTDTTDGFSDSFDLTYSDANPGVGADYAVSNESGGYQATDMVFDLVSYNGGASFLASSITNRNMKFDFFDPNPYTGDSSGALDPGVYTGEFSSTLTISVPEPEAWALIVGGAAMAGGALRARRRKVASLA
jgi:hypothetical protein